MPGPSKKLKPVILIIFIALLLTGYILINHKQLKQDFFDGLNDGKAQRAKQDSIDRR